MVSCTECGHQCVFVASSEEVDIQRSQIIFSSIMQVVFMSESDGISENMDVGLRNEDSQEDRICQHSRNLTLVCL